MWIQAASFTLYGCICDRILRTLLHATPFDIYFVGLIGFFGGTCGLD